MLYVDLSFMSSLMQTTKEKVVSTWSNRSPSFAFQNAYYT